LQPFQQAFLQNHDLHQPCSSDLLKRKALDKNTAVIDMPFPDPPPFNPEISKTRILGPSSGNPKAFQDPNSVATIGSKIQAMADQAKADTLYDPPPPIPEGFRNETYKPWIPETKEGFKTKLQPAPFYPPNSNLSIIILGLLGLFAISLSFRK
jgi:hypothetical protein